MRDEYQEHWLREHRWKVALTTIAVLGFLAMWAVNWAKEREKKETIERFDRIEEEIRSLEPPPPTMPEDPPPAPPAPPVRFQVVAGDRAADIVGGEATLSGISVRELPDAEFAGAGFSFRHSSAVSVAPAPDGSVVAAIDGACLVLAPLQPGEEMAPGFPGTGAADGPAGPVQRPIGDSGREGTRQRRSSGAAVETYAIDLEKRRIGIALYRDGDGRNIGPLEEVLASLEPGAANGGRQFELVVGEAPKKAIALDAPLATGKGKKVRVKRRSTILRTVGALEFEHPWSLAVSALASDSVTSVAVLRGRSVAIRLVALPMAMSVGAARSSLLGQVEARPDGDVEATFGGDEVRGKRFALAADIAGDVRAELFVLKRGGKHIGAAVLYRDAEQGDALALAEPVLTSVH